jgi:glycosyltransferase involved in cell wall biosynthesis
MRIAMLSYGHLEPTPRAPEVGGSARQCLKLSKALARKNIEVAILTNRLSWGDPAEKTIDGVRVVYLNTWRPIFDHRGLGRFRIYAYMVCVLGYLWRHKDEYDVIHAHSALEPGFVGVLAARWLNKKSIIKMMNSGFRNDIARFRGSKTMWGSRAMADYLIHCDRVIALNNLARDELIGFGYRPEQIELIPNGVQVDAIRPKTSYNSSGATRLAFVGRLARAKGLDVLLKAIEILKRQAPHPGYWLTILGRGALQQHLEEMSEDMGISAQVEFAGEVADVESHLAQSDIFVLPSHAEGISNALLEAMAVGCPCITTNIPGNNSLIQHEQNGLLVEQGDARGLAAAIERLATHSELRQQFGRAARETVEKRFDISSIADRYIRLYDSLVETSNVGQSSVPEKT